MIGLFLPVFLDDFAAAMRESSNVKVRDKITGLCESLVWCGIFWY